MARLMAEKISGIARSRLGVDAPCRSRMAAP